MPPSPRRSTISYCPRRSPITRVNYAGTLRRWPIVGTWPAIEHLQHAIDCDPRYALAHVALASAYNFLGFYALVKPTLAFAVAARAAGRALAIDAGLGPAHVQIVTTPG